jgi:hypothetical protein
MAETNTNQPAASRPWMPFALMILAAALAHLWCLGSQFYMDDMVGIRDSEHIRNGDVFGAFTLRWTYLSYHLQYKLFGMSPVAFHAINWLLHTANACVLFVLARDLLDGHRDRDGVALFGAMLFAVHPLCSEVPNYARCQDLAWVTLFSLLGSWGILHYLRHGNLGALAGFALGVAGATLSKGPGFFHAVMMTSMVAVISLQPEHRSFIRRRAVWAAAALVAVLAVLWGIGVLPRWMHYAENTWSTTRFIGHAYTLARVFWEFAWRAVIPVKLSADHQIAETMVPSGAGWFGIEDRVAMVSAVSMLALAALGLFLIWKKPTRLFGACLFLFLATMLFRVMYIVPEFMPEYRIYPGMPWFCLGTAILLAALWRVIPGGGSPRWLAALILIPCVILSAKRSFVWHDTERLCMDILRQYPAQARAVWKMHDHDMDQGEWQSIINRQRLMWPPVFKSFMDQMQSLRKSGRDLNSGHFALADVACHGRYAIALTHVHGPAAGVAEIRRLETRMRQLGIREETNRTIWGYFHHARATVMELAGNYPQALESMRFQGVFKIDADDIRRVEGRIADKTEPAKQ